MRNHSKSTRKNHSMIQHMEFDSYTQAQDLVTASEKKVKRILIGLVLALISTAISAYAFFGSPKDPTDLYALSLLLAVPSYIIGGGFGKALKSAWNLAIFGWFILPIFPLDLLLAFVTLCAAAFCFCFVPAVFVLINYAQNAADLKDARAYLHYFTPAAEQSSVR